MILFGAASWLDSIETARTCVVNLKSFQRDRRRLALVVSMCCFLRRWFTRGQELCVVYLKSFQRLH